MRLLSSFALLLIATTVREEYELKSRLKGYQIMIVTGEGCWKTVNKARIKSPDN